TLAAKVVAVTGPFTVRKKDGGEFLKLEAVLEKSEPEAFKLNAFGPYLSFQLQRLIKINALVHFEKLKVTAANYVNFRIGTLTVEFKYTQESKASVLQNEFTLPELPLSSVADIKNANNVRRRIRIAAERFVLAQDNMALMGNVVVTDTNGPSTLRAFCTIKSFPIERKSEIYAGVVMVVTCTIRQGTDGAPTIRIEAWHDITFVDAEHQVLTRFAFRTAGRIFVEDDEDFLSASLRVISAPLSIENIPADTPLLFTAKVEEEDGELWFTIKYDELKVGEGEAEENLIVKLAKRFERTDDGFTGFATMVDKRSCALKVFLLGPEEQWPVHLTVNSVVRVLGIVEKINKRYAIGVGAPDDLQVIEEGTDRKSIGMNDDLGSAEVQGLKEVGIKHRNESSPSRDSVLPTTLQENKDEVTSASGGSSEANTTKKGLDSDSDAFEPSSAVSEGLGADALATCVRIAGLDESFQEDPNSQEEASANLDKEPDNKKKRRK
ncbi:hypothetical protein AAVH_28611, partial [Aphelenchoides avenae]